MGPERTDSHNLIMAILFSIAIIFGFQIIFAPQEKLGQRDSGQQSDVQQQGQDSAGPSRSKAPVRIVEDKPVLPREQALAACSGSDGQSLRIAIRTDVVTGSICRIGAVFDDLTLERHWETIKKQERIHLLRPGRTKGAYYVGMTWEVPGRSEGVVPGPDTVWQADRNTLEVGKPVTLSWTNGAGVEFRRTYSIDRKYLVTVERRVLNRSGQPFVLRPTGFIHRHGEPKTFGFFILSESGHATIKEPGEENYITVGQEIFDSPLDYSDIRDESQTYRTTGGWTAFSDQYWAVALAPEQSGKYAFTFDHRDKFEGYEDVFRTYFKTENDLRIAPGGEIARTLRILAGPKETAALKTYEENLGIPRFNWLVDWGWFFFLTQPFYWLLQIIFGYVGNFGVAILVVTILVKIVFFPLANRSYRSMSRMKKLQPEMMKLRERYADDKQAMNRELMALYKEKKINPASGCLPILLQIPVFFALYKTLFIAVDMRHAPFFWWIQDLSAPDPTTIVNLFGILPWGPSGIPYVDIGIWPIIMGLTMFLQQKINPPPADPMQQKIFMALPFVFTVMLAIFPAGLIIYWAWNNTLSIGQQWVIMKRMGVWEKKEAARNVRDLVPVEGEAGAAGDSGDAGDDEAAEARKPARRKASAPAGAGANPGRSKQSRNKPPAEKSGKGRSKGGRGRRSSSGRGRRK
ncbi:MAG: membrane protein insertase YidC [Rhodospirillaceae bacterium]|nr:membrane protein insertase YidC [Rhodospirillaceae bacterium]